MTTPPYEHLEVRPDTVWHDDGDECIGAACLNPAHYEEELVEPPDPAIWAHLPATSYERKPGVPRAVIGWVLAVALVLLAVLAVALFVRGFGA